MMQAVFLEPLTKVISQRHESVAGARAWTAEFFDVYNCTVTKCLKS